MDTTRQDEEQPRAEWILGINTSTRELVTHAQFVLLQNQICKFRVIFFR